VYTDSKIEFYTVLVLATH